MVDHKPNALMELVLNINVPTPKVLVNTSVNIAVALIVTITKLKDLMVTIMAKEITIVLLAHKDSKVALM